MTPERARAYAILLAVIPLIVGAVWLAVSSNGLQPNGKPIGTDFASFWSASKLALGGRAADVYVPAEHWAVQKAEFGGHVGWVAFFYPPTFLLLCLPLAVLPYMASLAAWLVLTGLAYVRVMKEHLGSGFGWWPILAFPAVLSNMGHGQNGLLSGALLGAGALLLDRRPIIAGALFGLLAYKPHLAIAVPVVLLATGRFRVIIAAGATALAFAAASWVVLGSDVWRGFFETSALARDALEHGFAGHAKMQSTFAGARLVGLSLSAAWLVHLSVAIFTIGVVTLVLTKRPGRGQEGAFMAIGTVLVSPFLFDYDLAILAIPLAWCIRDAMRTGFLPWERLILATTFLVPLVSRTIAMTVGLPITPLVVGLFLTLLTRRSLCEPRSDRAPAVDQLRAAAT